ncbi:MAG TPA: FecR domain-containing protein [Pedobacter sp.]|jgi:ferric-dicitrate binding protein FerR (iron transport regulator)
MENENYFWDITAKYLQGKASLSEHEALQTWRESAAENEAQFKAQEKLWKLTEYTASHEVNTEKAWGQTKSKIEAKREKETPIKRIILSSLKIAASIAIVLSSIWLFKNYFSSDEMIVVKSGSDKIEVVLPDSSHVWLNKGSLISYKKDFSGAERKVELEGEGFFEVKKDPAKPFIIRTGFVQTKVLGTSFNLRNYSGDKSIDLVVVTGKVSFKSVTGTSEAIITPGNGASFRKSDKLLRKYLISNNDIPSRQSKKLKFENAPLKNVLAELELFYGVDVQLQNDNIGACSFSGNFENAEFEEVLQVLQITLDLSYKRTSNHTYIITGQGCSK